MKLTFIDCILILLLNVIEQFGYNGKSFSWYHFTNLLKITNFILSIIFHPNQQHFEIHLSKSKIHTTFSILPCKTYSSISILSSLKLISIFLYTIYIKFQFMVWISTNIG